MTHAGPHRDDLHLTLDDRELRAFGSAGQQRTAAIALRMLEAETLRAALGFEPLFCSTILSPSWICERSARILELLGERGMGQTMLAVPRESDIPPELLSLDRARIQSGSVARTSREEKRRRPEGLQKLPRPESLKKVLAGFLDAKGLAKRVEQATQSTTGRSVVGPQIAKVTEALSVTPDGTLFVAVTTNAWMTELSLMEPELLRALNAQGGLERSEKSVSG